MTLITETVAKKQQILIINKQFRPISRDLQDKLEEYDSEVFISPIPPKNIDVFDHVFFLIDQLDSEKIKNLIFKKGTYIFINNKRGANKAALWVTKNKIANIKIINLDNRNFRQELVEKIFWFSFSKSREIFLDLDSLPPQKKLRNRGFTFANFLKSLTPIKSGLTKKRLITLGVSLTLIFHLIIIPFIALSSYFFYLSFKELKKERMTSSKKYLIYGQSTHALSKALYSFSRPGYLFMSLALLPDSFIEIDGKAQALLERSLSLYENGQQVVRLILKKDKARADHDFLLFRLQKIGEDIDKMQDDLGVLNQKLPNVMIVTAKIKTEVGNSLELIKKTKKILPLLPEILAKDTEKKYLLLFANNMELRPGGGFIGSFGILTVKDLTISNIEILDVYDADGQLTTHVNPPEAIRKYLSQPNWFLRDSAFSPDFMENYSQAKFFLGKELKATDFSGGVLITTTMIQNVLDAYGNLWLPNFDETVNRDNFYIKSQTYSEKDFFPGSTAKKNFLGTIARQILLNLDTASPVKLVSALKNSLDEKQMVMIFEDNKIQSTIDSLYWSGKTILPNCPNTSPCVNDYLFPLDANLGVNKANFYVSRVLTQRVKISKTGILDNTLIINFKNDSPSSVFPGGIYKNYFQILLPPDSRLKRITRNDALIEDFEEKQDVFKKIGFLLEVPVQSQTEVKIEYQLNSVIKKGRQLYQFVLQKQIGSKNSDLNLEVILPNNIHLLNQNFSPVVKDNRIFYNTSLTADKIFIFELIKD